MNEIINALNKTFDSDKLFILSMQNYRNNRISKEDRLTNELAAKLQYGTNIHQYKIQNEEGQEYIDLVNINSTSIDFKIGDIEWALEAKTFSPHQNSNNQNLFYRNSVRGLKSDLVKLNKYHFKKKYLLLYLFEISNFEGNYDILNTYFPILGTYLGKNKVECRQNIENVKKNNLISYLKEQIKKDSELSNLSSVWNSYKRKIGNENDFLEVEIHTSIFEF